MHSCAVINAEFELSSQRLFGKGKRIQDDVSSLPHSSRVSWMFWLFVACGGRPDRRCVETQSSYRFFCGIELAMPFFLRAK